MKRLWPLMLVLSSCTSAFERVREASTLEEARTLLQGATPSITPYPPNAEAWYFSKSECVLFIDGKKRQWKSAFTEAEQRKVKPSEIPPVLCNPSGSR